MDEKKETLQRRGDSVASLDEERPSHLERRTPTPQEKAEGEARRLTNERLAAISRVSAAIAQKFNDPLQAITNVLGGIHRRGSLEQEDMPLIDLAYQEVKKLNQLARDLREFYQPTLGKTDLFDVKTELEKIIDHNRQRISAKGITLTTAFDDNIPPIHAVADQINKLFQELLDTAVLACDKDDTIHISAVQQEDKVIVRIEDSGCGIDPEILPQLFEPFNQAQSKKTTRDLNLAISYAYTTLHGGTIDAKIDDGRVTILKVILPIDYKKKTSAP